ncbi:MAG TPA: DUF4469 domain-containing protein [bacterium]|nr:DUF4469 domain-containing protein [bacterium]
MKLEQIRADGVVSQATDEPAVLSSGAYARLHGALLGFDPPDESLGVFLMEQYGSGAFRCGPYASVKPSLVIFAVGADVPAGDYDLVVRTATKAGTIRSGVLPQTVRVGQV